MSLPSPARSAAKILLDSPSTGPALGFSRTAHALAQIVMDSSLGGGQGKTR